jgi:DNA-directed RNA polymerase specialized sigma24 family protein
MSEDDRQPEGSMSLEAALRGDLEAFGALVKRQRRLMLQAARRCVRRRTSLKRLYDDEDALQGALGELWSDARSGSLPPLEGAVGFMRLFGRALARWASAAADHEAARKRCGPGIRRGGRSPLPVCPGIRPEARATSPDDLDRLESRSPPPERCLMQLETVKRLLAALSARQKLVVGLRLAGFTVADISVRLGVSARTVKRTLRSVRILWRGWDLRDPG